MKPRHYAGRATCPVCRKRVSVGAALRIWWHLPGNCDGIGARAEISPLRSVPPMRKKLYNQVNQKEK
jgi:hypothetical protein